jgi:4-amino-4-deoxy-L-arabinose transferase-like glycosyltransferase
MVEPAVETRAVRPAPLLAAVVVVVLIAFASGYGYHRDELYFLAAGRHLAWAYADQGVFTPLIARAMSEIAPHSLVVLRIPSALAAGTIVLLTGLLARELGGSRRAEAIAAACSGVAVIVLFTGHLLSTSTFDLLAWTAITWLVVRALRSGNDRLWLVTGVVLGVGLMNKPLPAFLAVGLMVGVAISGPRRLLWNRYVWAGAAIALVIWSPWIIWQASNGWPQIDVSRSIAEGNSTSSQPWWALVPFQFLLVSPVLAPVWIAGLVRLFRDPSVREFRFFASAWVLLAIVFMASGGKPYYLAGLLPLLLGAGAVSVDGWLTRGRTQARAMVVVAAVALSAVIDATISLPILPASSADPVIAVNGDVGETIGWPAFARTVARVYERAPRAVILTSNYGEAGAVDRYGGELGLPEAYSGHNGFGYWGHPPGSAGPVVTIGFDMPYLAAHFRGCVVAARINTGVDNDEDGEAVSVCRAPKRSWAREWPSLRHLG